MWKGHDEVLAHARRALESFEGQAIAWDERVRGLTAECDGHPELCRRLDQELRDVRDRRDALLIKLEALSSSRDPDWRRRLREFQAARRQLLLAWNVLRRRADRALRTAGHTNEDESEKGRR